MGFPNGREFAVQCKSDGVRGNCLTQRHGGHGGYGGRESGASPMRRERFRSTGRSGGGAEICFKILFIHLTEDPDLQDAGRVHR